MSGRTNKSSPLKKLLLMLAAGLLVMMLAGVAGLYLVAFQANVNLRQGESSLLHIPSGSDFRQLTELLLEEELLKNPGRFVFLARQKNLDARVMPGRYRIQAGMGNNALINLLRSGQQEPLMLTLSNIRSVEQVAGRAASRLEMDSLDLMQWIGSQEVRMQYGFDSLTIPLMFIPNTYEFFWNTSAKAFADRMHREYERFWHDERRERARQIGLGPKEVGILASIVQMETNRRDEMARIAGVYINRLNRNMPLQADPTIVYALGEQGINRVLNRHLSLDSPFNTYLYTGLPPGPISMPEPFVIDQVLHYEEHDYLFFAARDDFSGYHAFARTYSEHLANARRYRQALDRLNIMN